MSCNKYTNSLKTLSYFIYIRKASSSSFQYKEPIVKLGMKISTAENKHLVGYKTKKKISDQ